MCTVTARCVLGIAKNASSGRTDHALEGDLKARTAATRTSENSVSTHLDEYELRGGEKGPLLLQEKSAHVGV
jgi:N-methylhydantoinase B/oxoprolinase/acetone carboxylase alpha subunit